MTPTATLLIRQMQAEANSWDDIATSKEGHDAIRRNRAEARRDQLDWCIAQLRVALPAIEAEAVAEAMGTAEWLDSGAGVAA